MTIASLSDHPHTETTVLLSSQFLFYPIGGNVVDNYLQMFFTIISHFGNKIHLNLPINVCIDTNRQTAILPRCPCHEYGSAASSVNKFRKFFRMNLATSWPPISANLSLWKNWLYRKIKTVTAWSIALPIAEQGRYQTRNLVQIVADRLDFWTEIREECFYISMLLAVSYHIRWRRTLPLQRLKI